MFFYFRQLRRQLLFSKKTRKYILYALGEIILIVIGIYIAFEIDQYKEVSEKNERAHIVLQEVLNNLKQDIIESRGILASYKERDSLISLQLMNQIPLSEFQKEENIYLRNSARPFSKLTISKTGFENLKQLLPSLPTKFRPIVNDLQHLYNETAQKVVETQVGMNAYGTDITQKLVNKYEWFHASNEGLDYSRASKFYKENPIYKNQLSLFQNKLESSIFNIANYQQESLLQYLIISELIHNTDPVIDFLEIDAVDLTWDVKEIEGDYMAPDGFVSSFSFYGKFLVLQEDSQTVMMFYPEDQFVFKPFGLSGTISLIYVPEKKQFCFRGFPQKICAQLIEEG